MQKVKTADFVHICGLGFLLTFNLSFKQNMVGKIKDDLRYSYEF